MSKIKKVDVSQLIVGRRYVVECGHLCGNVAFVRSEKSKSRTYYRFTYADDVNNWLNDFGIIGTKSNLRIWEVS